MVLVIISLAERCFSISFSRKNVTKLFISLSFSIEARLPSSFGFTVLSIQNTCYR